jgi:hypothetical protein
MAELEPVAQENAAPTPADAAPQGRSKDDVALELMKFIAVQTGYGRSSQSSAGFSGKPTGHASEEHAVALLELFQRCRKAVKQED